MTQFYYSSPVVRQCVRGRNSDNKLIREKLGWNYSMTLKEGIARTYKWINEQVKKKG